MLGLSIKAPEKTIEERRKLQKEVQNKLEAKHKKHAQTLKNIKEGTYGKTYVGENMKYHLYNNNTNNNINNENLENIKYINNENTLFNNYNTYKTPIKKINSLKPTPPKLNRTLKRKIYNMNNENNNFIIPSLKRMKLQNQLGGKSRKTKRRTQRKTSRRYN
jgi:hypothetical protein